MVGTHFLIGISERTNEEGARQLGTALAAGGHSWQSVPVGAGLHLKSSVNLVAPGTLLVTEAVAQREEIADFDQVTVPAAEDYAANTLLLNGKLITPAGYPRTRRMLEVFNLPIIELDTGEFRKMDGGLTCLSLRF
jgi:dimethylargininase